MFHKPFKVKSQTVLKSSDKKKLITKIKDQMELEESIFTNKEEVMKIKVFSNKGESCFVYRIRENPMLFEVQEKIYPTVYLLWENPKLVSRVKTFHHVIKILIGGADLMLPGLVVTENEDYYTKPFTKSQVVSVTTTDSNWPVAVGFSLVDSNVLTVGHENKGKGVIVNHVFGDHLWQMGKKTSPPKGALVEEGDITNLGNKFDETIIVEQIDEESQPTIEEKKKNDNEESEQDKVLTHDERQTLLIKEKVLMDELLQQCFLTALKAKLKDKDLPSLTSNFYRNLVLTSCPDNNTLDVKKTTFKKLSVFMNKMADLGLIKLKEISKGSEGIVEVNRTHPLYRAHVACKQDTKEDKKQTLEVIHGVLVPNEYSPPEISSLYRITGSTYDLLQSQGVKRNSSLSMGEIRKLVSTYVTTNNLSKDMMVSLDPYLHRSVCEKNEGHITSLPWDAVYKRLFKKLPIDHQLKFPGILPIIGKGEPPKITIVVEKRIGNKSMTVVKYLDKFRIGLESFADHIKKLAQASSIITEAADNKHNCDIVQVQGNQIKNCEKVLTEKYKIHTKYISGLENAPKKKKNRR